MRGLLLAAALGVLAQVGRTLEPAAAGEGDDRAFVAIAAPATPVFEQARLRLRVTFGVDSRFFAEHALQLFRQPLDLPLHLDAPWLDAVPDTVRFMPGRDPAVELDADARPRRTVALNDRVVAAVQVEEREVAGRHFTVFAVEQELLPTTARSLELRAPSLRFAYTTRFDADLVRGQVATDRHEVRVEGVGMTVVIQPLPVEGRPQGFGGAVGRFSITSATDVRELAMGEHLKFTVEIAGEGNVDRLEMPRLGDLDGLHVFGRLDQPGRGRRTVIYDLAPTRVGALEIPPIDFAFFDPEPPGRYDLVRTAAIGLTVTPGADRIIAVIPSVAGAAGAEEDDRSPALVAAGIALLVAPALLGIGLIVWRRSARRRGSRSAGAAAADVSAPLGEPGVSGGQAGEAQAVRACVELLAARLGCSSAAVIAPDLSGRLERAGLPPELARRAAGLVEAVVAARYRGAALSAGPPLPSLDEIRQLFMELDDARATRPSS